MGLESQLEESITKFSKFDRPQTCRVKFFHETESNSFIYLSTFQLIVSLIYFFKNNDFLLQWLTILYILQTNPIRASLSFHMLRLASLMKALFVHFALTLCSLRWYLFVIKESLQKIGPWGRDL